MTYEELMIAIETLRAEGYDDESMLKVFYLMYSDGKIDTDTLRTLTEVLGYEFTEDFENMSEEDKHTKGLVPVEDDEEDDEDEEDCKPMGMTMEELKEFIEDRKAKGESEEDMLKIFYTMYVKGDIELSDLRTFTEALGWKFTDEFEAMSEEDKKKRGIKKEEDDE